jgi:Tfp pilus assembly protein PilO
VIEKVNAIDRLNGRLAVLLATAAILLITLMGWFLLVAPKRSKAADLDAKTSSAQVELVGTQQFLKSSAGRKSALQLKQLQRAVPADTRMSGIIRQLTRAARASGVRVTGITPNATVSTPGGQAIPLTVLAEGHFFRLQRFVRLLRSAAVVTTDSVHVSGRLLTLDSVDFASGGPSGTVGAGSKGLITATLIVDAYISTPGAPTGQAGTGTSTSTSNP